MSWAWFDRDALPEPMTPALEWQFWTGNEIGRLARSYLGAGKLLPSAPRDTAALATETALADQDEVLVFEATFTAGAFVARADGMRRMADGWELIEVKAGKCADDGKIRLEYILDIAYTIFVARGAGVSISRATLVQLNRAHTLGGEPLFASADISMPAFAMADAFEAQAAAIEQGLLSDQIPSPELIFACRGCPHFEVRCVGRGVPDPIFHIPHLSKQSFEQLKSYKQISRLPPGAKLTPAQRRHTSALRTGRPWVNQPGLDMLDELAWPVAYLDFEGMSPPQPWFAGMAPYEVIPFQYSIHIRLALSLPAGHVAYLADPETDWRRELATRLLRDLGDTGSIVVYSGYEKTQLKAMARMFPDLEHGIEAVIDRLFDLEPIFREGYIHADFHGRTSIKVVLPVLTGEHYDDLEIGDGLNAAAVFGLMRMGRTLVADHPRQRENLSRYCELDTWAMLRLHEELEHLRTGTPVA